MADNIHKLLRNNIVPIVIVGFCHFDIIKKLRATNSPCSFLNVAILCDEITDKSANDYIQHFPQDVLYNRTNQQLPKSEILLTIDYGQCSSQDVKICKVGVPLQNQAPAFGAILDLIKISLLIYLNSVIHPCPLTFYHQADDNTAASRNPSYDPNFFKLKSLRFIEDTPSLYNSSQISLSK